MQVVLRRRQNGGEEISQIIRRCRTFLITALSPFLSFDSKLFANPKNKSGYKFIVDKSGSLGWVILKEGTSEYGRYGSVEEALEEAFKANLNL